MNNINSIHGFFGKEREKRKGGTLGKSRWNLAGVPTINFSSTKKTSAHNKLELNYFVFSAENVFTFCCINFPKAGISFLSQTSIITVLLTYISVEPPCSLWPFTRSSLYYIVWDREVIAFDKFWAMGWPLVCWWSVHPCELLLGPQIISKKSMANSGLLSVST